jgi:hypothetical protein
MHDCSARPRKEVVRMLAGLLLGFLIGLIVGPVVRSWIAWREYSAASREAELAEGVLRAMSNVASRGGERLQPPRGGVRPG